MSIKVKLSVIISIIVTAILLLNNTMNYLSNRGLLISAQELQMAMVSKEIRIAIEHSKYGSAYVENVIGQELRVASIAAQNALDPNIDNVTNAQLSKVAKQIGVSDITLFKRMPDGDIVGLKSSDPKEINLSTKDWGYWFDAMNQLFDRKAITVKEGQTLQNYWSGPIDISSSDPSHVNKWGYYYDGTTNYIINPYVKDEYIMRFEQAAGPNAILDKTRRDNKTLLEIAGINPDAFGKPPKYTERNGSKYVELGDRDVLFGTYQYDNKAVDVPKVKEAVQSGHTVSYDADLNGKHVIKTFMPVPGTATDKPYVIALVTDYSTIQNTLNQQLIRNVSISIGVLMLSVLVCYMFAGFLVRPVHLILEKVNEIAKGNFDKVVAIKRKDELGMLADRVDVMSSNLQIYTKELRDKTEENLFQANHDSLTGLPNRRYFREILQTALKQAEQSDEQLAVMFIDLDRFKNINDTLGHSVGDVFLQQVAIRLADCLPEGGTISRHGGDEFTLILPQVGEMREAEEVAERIIETMTDPYHLLGHELFSSISIGISMYPDDGDDLDTLIKNADMAMFLAKEQGGNNYKSYNTKLNESAHERMVLETKLRKAIERGELQLNYQPKLDLATNRITGMETLVRWNNPDLGFISPGVFIPVAEETGLIVEIGEWVLRTACAQNKAWQDAGYAPLRVAVNLSARQFVNHDLVQTVRNVLQDTGLDPNWLELEITESILMQNTEEIIATLHVFKQMGIQIAIDDFGTGYSSLSYLKRFPIDSLKIDQSFVRDITDDLNDAEIATAIISLGHSLNLKVIAEGVETTAQQNFLVGKLCDEMQGYLFSRPLTTGDFEKLLQRRAENDNF
ncbi:MAG: putative bifunctional diguanylate cyclase/phosphodiesterase [Tumebacillaceae bacterium]